MPYFESYEVWLPWDKENTWGIDTQIDLQCTWKCYNKPDKNKIWQKIEEFPHGRGRT